MRIIVLIYLLPLIWTAQAARILLLFTLPGRSHFILGSSLARALVERGHDVTLLSAFSEKIPSTNGTYTEVTISGFFEEMQAKMEKEMNMFDQEGSHPIVSYLFMSVVMQDMLAKTLDHENVKQFLSTKQKFDVVIIEQFLNDAYKTLATYFDARLIIFSSLSANFWVNTVVGNPAPPSYIPDMISEYSIHMSFCERVSNTMIYVINELLHHLYIFPRQNSIVKKYLPSGLDLYDVLYNTSLVLLNSHPSINQAVPYVPNMIEIGGFHIKPPKKLPKDLQEFLDNASDGVVYFSMGSNLKSAQFPTEKREALLNTFAKLKQKVLWKWEEDVLPGQPSNVKLGKWLPQQDILAHPNVKLFITHGGLLSTTETVYHGVPILAIPIFGDQKINAKVAVNSGFGLSIAYSELSEDKLTKSINELLSNPKYQQNAKTRSKLFHDRLVSPMDTAMYWIEYVIRHKGAPHLRVAALDLPWYKYHLLDVIGFVAAICLILILTVYFVMKIIFKKLFAKKLKTS